MQRYSNMDISVAGSLEACKLEIIKAVTGTLVASLHVVCGLNILGADT